MFSTTLCCCSHHCPFGTYTLHASVCALRSCKCFWWNYCYETTYEYRASTWSSWAHSGLCGGLLVGPLALRGGPHQKLGLSSMLRMTQSQNSDSCSATYNISYFFRLASLEAGLWGPLRLYLEVSPSVEIPSCFFCKRPHKNVQHLSTSHASCECWRMHHHQDACILVFAFTGSLPSQALHYRFHDQALRYFSSSLFQALRFHDQALQHITALRFQLYASSSSTLLQMTTSTAVGGDTTWTGREEHSQHPRECWSISTTNWLSFEATWASFLEARLRCAPLWKCVASYPLRRMRRQLKQKARHYGERCSAKWWTCHIIKP